MSVAQQVILICILIGTLLRTHSVFFEIVACNLSYPPEGDVNASALMVDTQASRQFTTAAPADRPKFLPNGTPR